MYVGYFGMFSYTMEDKTVCVVCGLSLGNQPVNTLGRKGSESVNRAGASRGLDVVDPVDPLNVDKLFMHIVEETLFIKELSKFTLIITIVKTIAFL